MNLKEKARGNFIKIVRWFKELVFEFFLSNFANFNFEFNSRFDEIVNKVFTAPNLLNLLFSNQAYIKNKALSHKSYSINLFCNFFFLFFPFDSFS